TASARRGVAPAHHALDLGDRRLWRPVGPRVTGEPIMIAESQHPARWFHTRADGRMQCDLCPRDCTLSDGQRGLCFVRKREGDAMVLTTYGRSSGFCVDPIEK